MSFTLLLIQLLSGMSVAEAIPSPGGIEGFPRTDYETIAFVGTVTKFETPVYGLDKNMDPVSIIHFDVEERILGGEDVNELVSYGALWTGKHGKVVSRWSTDKVRRALYLNPGMRVLIVGSRPNPELAKAQGYPFGGHFVATFCRLLPSTAQVSKAEPLRIIGDMVPPTRDNDDSTLTLEQASAGPFNIPTVPDSVLTLDTIKRKLHELYGGQ